MRKLKALGATTLVVGLATFPAAGAITQLGAALAAIDRMHRSGHASAPVTAREVIGTYEVDSATSATGLRLHEAQVLRAGE